MITSQRGHRHGFTLVEILVTVAIISLLAAILLPVLSRVRENSRRASCLSNINQLCKALAMYVQDNDGKYNEPANGAASQQVGLPTLEDSQQLIWLGYLHPYTRSIQIAMCPSSGHQIIRRSSQTDFGGLTFAQVNRRQLSVGMSSYMAPWWSWQCRVSTASGLLASDPNSPCRRFHSEGNFKHPTRTVAFVDSVPWAPARSDGGGYWADPGSTINGGYGLSNRHNGGTNIGFLDGHAKWYKTETLLVADQADARGGSGQCVNYDIAEVYYDPTAPYPDEQQLCEGRPRR